jgi:transposase
MEYGAIDLHLRRSQIRIIDEQEQVVLDRRVETTRAEFDRLLAGRAPMRLLIESRPESEWVAQHLEGLGHEAVVVDPTYAAMYGSRSRNVKTDKRDVAALALANRRGVYRRAHRAPTATRQLRQQLRVRRQLVRQRTALVNLLRALLRQEGVRLPSGQTESVPARLDRLAVPATLQAALAPLRAIVEALNQTLATLDATFNTRAATDAVTQRLMTAPGVGPILALTFQAVLDTPDRFGGKASRASAFVGLVPREDSSAERRHQGSITKTGPGDLRALLVQGSWAIWHRRSARAAPWRAWALAVSARRGRRIAVGAMARRLTRVLYAMWRDATDFRVPARATPVAA